MTFDEKDLQQLENLAKILRKAKYEATGDEILAISQTFSWVGKIILATRKELEEKSQPKPSPMDMIGKPSGLLPDKPEEKKKEEPVKRRKPRRRATVKKDD